MHPLVVEATQDGEVRQRVVALVEAATDVVHVGIRSARAAGELAVPVARHHQPTQPSLHEPARLEMLIGVPSCDTTASTSQSHSIRSAVCTETPIG